MLDSPLDPRGIVSPLGRLRAFSPAVLFANGEPGVWLDPSDPSTLFTDNSGVTPVTTAGQTVALALDKSQGLVPGPELASTTSINGDPIGGPAFTNYSTGAEIVAGKRYLISYDVEDYSGSGSVSVGGAPGTAWESLSSVAVSENTTVTARLESLDSFTLNLFTRSSNTANFRNISVRELPGNHATQATTAARPTYQVTSGVPNLVDDAVDDVLNWTAPAGNYTIAYVNTSGTVTILTSQSLSGATDVLQVSPLVGYLAVNRALTPGETSNLTAYLERLAA